MAAIPSSIIEVPFAKGLDEKTTKEWVQVGTQTTAVNGSWAKNGSFRKRSGSTAISKQSLTASGNGPALTAGVAVEAYKNAPVVSDGSNLYAYDSIKGALLYEDQLPECIASRTPLSQSTVGILATDCAATNGYALYVYRATDVSGTAKNYATIVNMTTGAQIGPGTVLATSAREGLRCIASGNVFYALWTDAANHIVYSAFDTAGPFQWSVALTIVNTMSATAVPGAWDATNIDGTTNWVVGFQQTAAPDQLELLIFNSAGANIAAAGFNIGGGVLPIKAIGLKFTSGETGWVSYVTSDTVSTDYVRCRGVNPSTLATTVADTLLWSEASGASTTRRIGAARVSSTVVLVESGCSVSSNGLLDASWRQFNTAAATVGPQRTMQGYSMWSKPVTVGSKTYAVLWYHNDSVNQTFQLVDLITSDTTVDAARARPVATIGARVASFANGLVTCPNIASIGSSQWIVPVSVQISVSRSSVYQALLDFSSQQRHQAVELGDSLYIAGGVPSIFDGAQVVEHGFLAPPTITSVVAGGGGSMGAGTYQYALVWKWVNRRGELQRSTPAFSGQVVVGASGSVTVTANPYTLTTKQDADNLWTPAITFDLYRNTVTDPATFWQVTADALETPNDPRTVGTVAIVDTISDATLTGNAFSTLYTLGGVLADQCPPSLTCLTSHKNRIFAIGDDPTVLWFTKQAVTGFAPGWNDQLTLPCPDGGPITALASLDSLVVFKRDRVLLLGGSGPNVLGQQSDFTDLLRLPSDVGCTQPRSIVSATGGIFFLSTQGIYLLSRAGEAQYIGRAVEDTVLANPVCLAADIVPAKGEIRWSLAPSLTSSTGVTVVYDYIQDSWSVHQYYDTDRAVASAIAVGAKAPGGTWCWLGSGGQLNVESATSYLDGGSQWVSLQAASAWVKAGGISGWARFRRVTAVMEQASLFSLTVDVATDFNDTYAETSPFTDAQISSWTPRPIANVQVGNQKSEAIRIRLTDGPPTTGAVGTGAGAVLVGMNVEVAQLGGSKGKRLPPSQRA